jgi:hypothetical protein
MDETALHWQHYRSDLGGLKAMVRLPG